LITAFQVVNGRKPELIERASNGEHVGTIVRADP
jgi:isopentenyl phosphate kinase